jgi:integrase
VIDLSPMLLDELKAHKASAHFAAPSDFVFPTSKGTPLHRANISNRLLAGAIERANEKRTEHGRPPIQGVTNHTLRRTFASLLYEADASPAYVMHQIGHTSSALALEVYARKMERRRDTGERLDALIRGADWAPMGTNAQMGDVSAASPENEKPLFPAAS